MDCFKEKVYSNGLMAQFMKEILNNRRQQALEYLSGLMAASIKASLTMDKGKAKAHFIQQLKNIHTLAHGRKAKNMEKVNQYIKINHVIRVSFRMIKSMAMAK